MFLISAGNIERANIPAANYLARTDVEPIFKGLPPRVVILPDWDMSDEDRYDETRAKRRAKTTLKKRHGQPKAKGARQ